ncbi:response regulator [Caenispirillum salinarum]|uniref:response regulator n=1 Tax=Caenispirillum salinarum TaxID=859058 RepID=UPI00384AB9A7
MADRPHRVFIVDDDFLIVEYLRDAVEDLGLTVAGTAATADDAIRLVREARPDVVLMDVRLRGHSDGVDAARSIHADLNVPIIFITGSNEPQTLERIGKDSPRAVLIKPITPDQLQTVLRDMLD